MTIKQKKIKGKTYRSRRDDKDGKVGRKTIWFPPIYLQLTDTIIYQYQKELPDESVRHLNDRCLLLLTLIKKFHHNTGPISIPTSI